MLTFPHFEPHFARAHWTLPHVLEHQARDRAQRPFLSWTDAGPALSYAEVNSPVNRLATAWQPSASAGASMSASCCPTAWSSCLPGSR
jgi:acyl-CoA synthetase (AMP-forming)/AMP-acid ligase II